MSSSNSNVGISLTALATGTAIANISTNAGATNLDGTTNKMFIGQNCSYTQIATSTATNNAMTLPNNPVVGQTYTIRNDGAYIVNLFPGTSTSQFQYSGGLTNAGNAIQIGSGDAVTVLCSSSNGASNTNAGANPFNNPVNIYQVVNESMKLSPVVPISGTANTSLTTFQSGTTFYLATNTGARTINLPAPAVSAGVSYKFVSQVATPGNNWTISSPTAGTLSGYVIGATTRVACQSNASLNWITANVLIGDCATFFCDGAEWYVQAFGATAGVFTVS